VSADPRCTLDPAGADRLHAERLHSQLLAGPVATSPGAVVERLLAVQAQDPRGHRLAVRARTSGLTVADVDAALDSGELLVTWVNRGTLHLVRAEDYGWLHALTTPQLLTGNARRLRQEGVSPRAAERGVAAVVRALERDGPSTRRRLREHVASAGVRAEGQALVHVLMLASLRGLVVRGPTAGGDQSYVLVREWLGSQPALDHDTALGELARRYLVGHGPADEKDLAKWAGIPLGTARRAFASTPARTHDRAGGLVSLTAAPRRRAVPRPRLLGPYDPVLLGWTSRAHLLGRHSSVVTVNGLFRPFAMVRGHAVGRWSFAGGRVALDVADPVDPAEQKALLRDAADVERFLRGAPQVGADGG
jgi:hypothetical protein